MISFPPLAPIALAALLMGAVALPYARPVACAAAHAEQHATGHAVEHQSSDGPVLKDAGASCHDIMLCCAVDGARKIESAADFVVALHQSTQIPSPARRPVRDPTSFPTPPPRV